MKISPAASNIPERSYWKFRGSSLAVFQLYAKNLTGVDPPPAMARVKTANVDLSAEYLRLLSNGGASIEADEAVSYLKSTRFNSCLTILASNTAFRRYIRPLCIL